MIMIDVPMNDETHSPQKHLRGYEEFPHSPLRKGSSSLGNIERPSSWLSGQEGLRFLTSPPSAGSGNSNKSFLDDARVEYGHLAFLKPCRDD